MNRIIFATVCITIYTMSFSVFPAFAQCSGDIKLGYKYVDGISSVPLAYNAKIVVENITSLPITNLYVMLESTQSASVEPGVFMFESLASKQKSESKTKAKIMVLTSSSDQNPVYKRFFWRLTYSINGAQCVDRVTIE